MMENLKKFYKIKMNLKHVIMLHEESKLQRQCVQWFRLQFPQLVLFAIPNGGRRGKVEAAIMKGEGVLAGVADLFLMLPTMAHNGLFIEMKTHDGKQSDSQRKFERKARENSYEYKICRTFEDFRDVVLTYTDVSL
ncbi:MAG: VRR-NUC domain-containing protein [Oscillospiraceae bacterium]|nr:VRR-NUC domain-containing protein [Oscillospiraceae bacterium]